MVHGLCHDLAEVSLVWATQLDLPLHLVHLELTEDMLRAVITRLEFLPHLKDRINVGVRITQGLFLTTGSRTELLVRFSFPPKTSPVGSISAA